MKNVTTPLLVFAVAMITAASANAAIITGVTIADFSSERGGFGSFAVNTVNGSGFDEVAGTHSNDGRVAWSSNTVDGDLDTTPFITFDLGAVYVIDSFSVWNFNQTPNAGINAVTITYGETLALGSTLTEVTNFSQADGTDSYTGETFSGFTPFSARYIKFDATSNYGNSRSGLAEVRFNETAVPEPSSSLALIGLGAMLAARRRRR